MGRPSVNVNPTNSTAPGGSNIGLMFGDYLAIFHPGHSQGAFRLEKGLYSQTILVNNQNMGFTPALDTLHHVEAFVGMQGSSLAIDISISGLGTDSNSYTYNLSYLDPSPSLGSGAIGVQLQRLNIDDGYFDNLVVEGREGTAYIIPEPITLALAPVGCLAVLGYILRYRRRSA